MLQSLLIKNYDRVQMCMGSEHFYFRTNLVHLFLNHESFNEKYFCSTNSCHLGSPIEAIMHVDSSQFSCMSQPLTKQGMLRSTPCYVLQFMPKFVTPATGAY